MGGLSAKSRNNLCLEPFENFQNNSYVNSHKYVIEKRESFQATLQSSVQGQPHVLGRTETHILKSNQVTEIGAFMVRTNLASEFEFPAQSFIQ